MRPASRHRRLWQIALALCFVAVSFLAAIQLGPTGPEVVQETTRQHAAVLSGDRPAVASEVQDAIAVVVLLAAGFDAAVR